MPKAAGHKDGKKWPAIPVFVLSMCLFALHLLGLLFWWRGGHPELKLGSGGTDAVGSGQSRLGKLCPGCLLAQMAIHKGRGEGVVGAWKCNCEEGEQERLADISPLSVGLFLAQQLWQSSQIWAPTEKRGFHTFSTWGSRSETLLCINSGLLPAAATG